ncbi:uncharacterized protein UTRI_06232_B [Ustilago trichophora]|uniref:Uncharacterized protein n=1 Tax=Ustilago trichophora TaxID=86804 RepID=A0A5C3EJV5_9BASI|nr:uncharacterized protein UTRI_06232_B [Ustilago trichophora]
MTSRLTGLWLGLCYAFTTITALTMAHQSHWRYPNPLARTVFVERAIAHPPDPLLVRHIDELNRQFSYLSLPYQATPHRNTLAILNKTPSVAKSIRSEMLAFGKDLPLVTVSQAWFPWSKQVFALPLRYPHGQGGPGTTLAIIMKDASGGLKITGFSHVVNVHPDDLTNYLAFLKERGATPITTLGSLFPKIDWASAPILHVFK